MISLSRSWIRCWKRASRQANLPIILKASKESALIIRADSFHVATFTSNFSVITDDESLEAVYKKGVLILTILSGIEHVQPGISRLFNGGTSWTHC